MVVYVWRQVTAEAVCALLQGDGHSAVAYHGGMEAGARQKAQNAFMRGRARVVVATVAFGLGVDMRDIRGVVHFDMPKSIENYVQVWCFANCTSSLWCLARDVSLLRSCC